jgi:hypothetical protein
MGICPLIYDPRNVCFVVYLSYDTNRLVCMHDYEVSQEISGSAMAAHRRKEAKLQSPEPNRQAR